MDSVVPAFEMKAGAQQLDSLFAACDRDGTPGLAVGLALNGEVAYRRGFGRARAGLPQPLGPGTPLRIGSVSKHFLCLLLLQLAQEGRLSLDDSPRRHVPRLPPWADAMTLRQLMNHSSGMRCSLDLLMQTAGLGQPVPAQAQLDLLCAQTDLNFAPGTGWCYSNGGYVLLGHIAERVAGAPLEELLRRRLFEPAGLCDTTLRRHDTDLPPGCAASHLPATGGGYARTVFGPSIGGEGGVVSTVDDMLRWMARMSASWDALCTSRAPNGYGLGIYSGVYRGTRIVHHGGNVIGGSCLMLHLPDIALDLILITNRGDLDAESLALRVIDACVGGLEQAPEQRPDRGLPDGDFHNAPTGSFLRLLTRQNRRYGQFHASPLPLREADSGTLAVDRLGSDSRLTPVIEGEAVVALELLEGGRSERLWRLPPADPACNTAVMPGTYRCAALDAAATIAPGSGSLQMRSPFGAMRYALEPLGPGLCLASTGDPLLPLGGLLEFDHSGFRYSSQRTRRLHFARQP